MILEHCTSISKMLLALVFAAVLACPLAGSAHPEDVSKIYSQRLSSSAELESHCGLRGDHDTEGLSLLQVGAKRLEKAVAAKSKADVSNVAATKEAAAQGQGRLQALLAQARMRSSATFSIVVVAVVGLVALTLLAFALQPSHGGRDSLARGSISQNFPRATQSGPCVRQGGPSPAYYPAADSYKVPGYVPYSAGFDDGRPSVRDSFMPPPSQPYQQGVGQPQTAPDSLQGSMAALPDPSQHRSLPRISTPAVGSSRGLPLPRVQGPGARPSGSSRPGTGLNLTPAQSLAPMKQDLDKGFAALPVPDVHCPPEVTGSAPRRPPPLCPMLVLPHCESFFAVPIDQLVSGTTTVEILGLSGNALLRSTVKDTEEGRVIEVSMSPPRSPPLASISAPTIGGPRAGLRELKGSRGKHYGWLRPNASGYGLRCGEDDVMTVVTSSSGQLQLYAGSSGDLLAQASRSADGERIFAPEDLEVRVTPGMDAVLAILCVVSAALFADGPSPF